ncbi:MAG: hypothetical protein U0872_09270 [Planctomycetaceae bacterium]
MTRSPAEQDAGTWAAVFALAVVGLGLLGLAALVTPHLLGIMLVVGGFVGFGAFHYLVWGWWLGRRFSDEAASAKTEEPHPWSSDQSPENLTSRRRR